MRSSNMFFSLAFFILFFAFSSKAQVLPVPPMNISGSDLAHYLKLGANVSFPAIFVFGDLYLDSGNNNYLLFHSKSNFTPYGIDFGGKATGRVTNGRISVDFIAQLAGLPFPAAYEGLSLQEKRSVLTSINFASASAGVLPEPHPLRPIIGEFLSLDIQVRLFEQMVSAFRSQFDSPESLARYLAKSIFFHHVSSNDLGIYWEVVYKHKYNNTNDYFTFIIQEYSKQLKKLYELGARKFLINNVSPMGCMPYLKEQKNITTGCDEEMNRRVLMYNQLLQIEILNLQVSLTGSKFIFADFNKIISDIYKCPSLYGIRNVKESCCTCGPKNSSCVPNQK